LSPQQLLDLDGRCRAAVLVLETLLQVGLRLLDRQRVFPLGLGIVLEPFHVDLAARLLRHRVPDHPAAEDDRLDQRPSQFGPLLFGKLVVPARELEPVLRLLFQPQTVLDDVADQLAVGNDMAIPVKPRDELPEQLRFHVEEFFRRGAELLGPSFDLGLVRCELLPPLLGDRIEPPGLGRQVMHASAHLRLGSHHVTGHGARRNLDRLPVSAADVDLRQLAPAVDLRLPGLLGQRNLVPVRGRHRAGWSAQVAHQDLALLRHCLLARQAAPFCGPRSIGVLHGPQPSQQPGIHVRGSRSRCRHRTTPF